MLIDHHSDLELSGLIELPIELRRLAEDVRTRTKTASSQGLVPPKSYAWEDQRLFPVDTPEDAVLSYLYVVKQAAEVPDVVKRCVRNALDIYDIDPAVIDDALRSGRTKQASPTTGALYAVKLASGERILPISHPQDVLDSAATLVEQRARLKTSTVRKAAEAITARIAYSPDQFGNVTPAIVSVFKLAGYTQCDPGLLTDHLGARAGALRKMAQERAHTLTDAIDPEDAHSSLKVAQVLDRSQAQVVALDRLAGAATQIHAGTHRDELVKLADALEEFDQLTGLDRYYHKGILTPMESVFNTHKLAEEMVALAGNQVPLSKLSQLPMDVFGDIFGDEFVAQIDDGQGGVDPMRLKQTLPTLPLDMQTALFSTAAPYLR